MHFIRSHNIPVLKIFGPFMPNSVNHEYYTQIWYHVHSAWIDVYEEVCGVYLEVWSVLHCAEVSCFQIIRGSREQEDNNVTVNGSHDVCWMSLLFPPVSSRQFGCLFTPHLLQINVSKEKTTDQLSNRIPNILQNSLAHKTIILGCCILFR